MVFNSVILSIGQTVCVCIHTESVMYRRSSFNDGALSIRADFPDMPRAPL